MRTVSKKNILILLMVLSLLTAIVVIFQNCGGSGSGGSVPNSNLSTGPTVPGIAAMMMGPSTASVGASMAEVQSRHAQSLHAVVSGNYWALTPDQATVSFSSIQFLMSDGSINTSNLANCTGTYSTANSSGSQMFTCPVAVPVGTINAIGITTSASAGITINDTTHQIYTAPSSATGITIGISAPAGGVGVTNVTVPNTGNGNQSQYPIVEFLTTPLVVTAQSTPSLYVIVDMIHTLIAQDNGANGLVVQTATPNPPVRIFASFTGTASAEYYTTSGSAGNVNLGSSNADTYVTVDYLTGGQANHIWTIPCSDGNNPSEAWSISPANSPQGQGGLSAGGFLGLDSSGTLAVALPTSYTWATYRIYGQMVRQTILGQPTTMNCRRNDTGLIPPTPTDGNSYASGGDVPVGAAVSGAYTVESTSGLVLVAQ